MERTTVEKVSLWVKHAKVFNSYLKKFEEADVAVKGERFYYIDRKRELSFEAAEVLGASGDEIVISSRFLEWLEENLAAGKD